MNPHIVTAVARAIFLGDYPGDPDAEVVWAFATTNLPDGSIVIDYSRRARNAITAYEELT